MFRKLFITLFLIISSLCLFGQKGSSDEYINITPNQISNGWGAAYSNNGSLVLFYQILRSKFVVNQQYYYYIYFFSGHETNAIVLKGLKFVADGYNVGSLNSLIVPKEAINVYIIYSVNPHCQIGFTWQNSIIY